jgi:UDP-N-acetylmuramyl pentapeptide synthase
MPSPPASAPTPAPPAACTCARARWRRRHRRQLQRQPRLDARRHRSAGRHPGRKILVIGDMGEIGEQSFQYHDEIGGYAKSEGVDFLFGLGEMSEVAARNFGEGGFHFSKLDDLVAAVKAELNADTVVLVKGSRFMKMERVVDAIAEKV